MSDRDEARETDGSETIDTGDMTLRRGLQFHYEDGVAEAVVAVEGDRVLTVREYPSRESFREVADGAVATEVNEELRDIDAESIMDGSDGPTAGAAATGREATAPMGTEEPDEDDADGE